MISSDARPLPVDPKMKFESRDVIRAPGVGYTTRTASGPSTSGIGGSDAGAADDAPRSAGAPEEGGVPVVGTTVAGRTHALRTRRLAAEWSARTVRRRMARKLTADGEVRQLRHSGVLH